MKFRFLKSEPENEQPAELPWRYATGCGALDCPGQSLPYVAMRPLGSVLGPCVDKLLGYLPGAASVVHVTQGHPEPMKGRRFTGGALGAEELVSSVFRAVQDASPTTRSTGDAGLAVAPGLVQRNAPSLSTRWGRATRKDSPTCEQWTKAETTARVQAELLSRRASESPHTDPLARNSSAKTHHPLPRLRMSRLHSPGHNRLRPPPTRRLTAQTRRCVLPRSSIAA